MLLWFFKGIKEREDYNNIIGLFYTKELMNRGRVLIGDYYFTVKEQEKTYIVTIEDINKRKIVNSIFNKKWFEEHILEDIKIRFSYITKEI